MMKKALFYSLVVLFWSCDNGKQTQNTTPETTEVLETPMAVPLEDEEPEQVTIDSFYQSGVPNTLPLIDSSIWKHIKKLELTFSEVPYLFEHHDNFYFIVYNGEWDDDPAKRHEQEGQYGMVNDLNVKILETAYDKIYNPEVTFKASVEIKKDGKVGLYHFEDNELLKPQFDFIVPQHSPGQLAYGSKNGNWYSIAFNGKFHIKPTAFYLHEYLKEFPLQTESFYKTPLVNPKHLGPETSKWVGSGVAVVPSYLEQLNALEPVREDFILSRQNPESGSLGPHVSVTREEHLSDVVTSFLLSVYEDYFHTRDYGSMQRQTSLATFNQENHSFSYAELNQKNKEYFCQEENIRFINDSLLEVQATQSPGHLYNWESQFSYYRIMASGQIQALESHRHFDQSQFIRLEDRHFRGCFGKPMNEEERLLLKDEDSDLHIWRSQHLSVEDLDIMRNEIFAIYGYRFTSEKWRNYFNQFDWYQPAYDNVDDQLTELDKANIKTILALKATMTPHEEQFTKKEATGYSAPG